MAEHDTPVRMVRVDFECEQPYSEGQDQGACGALVKATGNTQLQNPPSYEHVCERGHIIFLPKVYPAIEYREVEANSTRPEIELRP